MIDKTEYERFREYLAKRGLSRNSCNHYVAYVSSIERHSTNFLNESAEKVEELICNGMGLTQDSAACYKRGYHLFCEFNEKISAAGRKSEASEDEEKEIAAEKKIICESIRNEYEGSYGKAADGKNWFQEIVVDDVSRWLPLVMKMNSVGGTGFERRSWAFRGQGNSDWGLESSLGRLLHFDWLGIGKWACGFEKEAMWEFSREVKCKFEWRSFEGADMLALMQHYGCKTRLLDFSLSPLVALYMAHEQNEITVIPQGCDKLTGRPILRGPVFDFPVMCV